MRTLEQEIAYCREKDFHRNTIELSTMYAWIGERFVEDMELKVLRESNFRLKDQNIHSQNELIEVRNDYEFQKRRNERLEAEVKALKDALRAYGDEDIDED